MPKKLIKMRRKYDNELWCYLKRKNENKIELLDVAPIDDKCEISWNDMNIFRGN